MYSSLNTVKVTWHIVAKFIRGILTSICLPVHFYGFQKPDHTFRFFFVLVSQTAIIMNAMLLFLLQAPVSKPSKACDGGSKPSKACDGGGSAAAATGGTGNWLDAFSLEYIDELATTSDLSSETSGLCRPPGSKSRDRLQVKSQMSLTKPKSLLEPSGKSYQSTPTTVPLNTQSPCAAEVTARKTSTTITHYDQAGDNQPHPPSKQLGSLPATSHGKSAVRFLASGPLSLLVLQCTGKCLVNTYRYWCLPDFDPSTGVGIFFVLAIFILSKYEIGLP